MVNNLSHRIFAVSMALLLLLSSTGFSMDAHYCQGELKNISLFGKAKGCYDGEIVETINETKKSCKNQHGEIKRADCCQNESLVIESIDTDTTNPRLANIQESQFELTTAILAVFVLNYWSKSDIQPPLSHKPPIPLDVRDIQVLYQTFLI